jgi:G protein beta subunit-like protein
VTCSSDQTGSIFDISRQQEGTTPQLMQTLDQHKQEMGLGLLFLCRFKLFLTAISDQTARLFNLRSGDVVKQHIGHNSAVTCGALNDSSS